MSTEHILVFNVGSSSVKSCLFKNKQRILERSYDRLTDTPKRIAAVDKILEEINRREIPLDAIAHRFVHGGTHEKSTIVTKDLLDDLHKVAELAPLHDIPELEVIQRCQYLDTPQIVVFDTAFHQTMPTAAKMYGLPRDLYDRGIRRYGFHGISHEYVTRGIKGKVISCHLGNGASVTAIKDHTSIDTTMGFTPLEGLIMGTRCGDIDPSIPLYLMRHEHMTLKQVQHLLNYESGLLGISGISSDMRDLLTSEDTQAIQAREVFVHRLIKAIGSAAATLDGVDTIVFAGGIGEGSAKLRAQTCQKLSYLGVDIDPKRNRAHETIISSDTSNVEVRVAHTDEEEAIRGHAHLIIKNQTKQQ